MSKNKSKAKPDLKKAAALAEKVADEFQSLWEMMGKPKGPINRYQNQDFLALVDELINIKSELIARTDGRPQPLDLSARYRVSEEKRAEYGEAVANEIEGGWERFASFGECFERGPGEDIASMGTSSDRVHLTMDDLKKLRDWVAAVIAWHEANPKRGK